MKFLLVYLIIGCIITIGRMIILLFIMRKGVLLDTSNGIKNIINYILVEILLGTLLWPSYPIMIIRVLWSFSHNRGDAAKKEIDEAFRDYFE